ATAFTAAGRSRFIIPWGARMPTASASGPTPMTRPKPRLCKRLCFGWCPRPRTISASKPHAAVFFYAYYQAAGPGHWRPAAGGHRLRKSSQP
nr:hypothetical protein [Tanacetum cinerariifolium]